MKAFRGYLRRKRFRLAVKQAIVLLLMAVLRMKYWPDPLLNDIDSILHFDNGMRKGQSKEVPQLQSSEGERLWEKYMRLYRTEKKGVRTEQVDRGNNTVWHCDCGRRNLSYIYTCVCGKQKREVPAERRDLPKQAERWYCTCGRINLRCVLTCDCGKGRDSL